MVLRCNDGKEPGSSGAPRFTSAALIGRLNVMGVIDVPTDAVTNGAANQRIGQEMVVSGVARNANGGRQPIGSNLDQAVISIFVCNDSC